MPSLSTSIGAPLTLSTAFENVAMVVTVNKESATPPGLQVYTAASYPNPIAGALCVGANVTSLAIVSTVPVFANH